MLASAGFTRYTRFVFMHQVVWIVSSGRCQASHVVDVYGQTIEFALGFSSGQGSEAKRPTTPALQFGQLPPHATNYTSTLRHAEHVCGLTSVSFYVNLDYVIFTLLPNMTKHTIVALDSWVSLPALNFEYELIRHVNTSPMELPERMKDATIVVTSATRVTRAGIENAPRLKLIACNG